MPIKPRNLRILNVFFLTFCFASSLIFSGYYEMDEADCFTLIPVFENPAPSIYGSVENSSFAFFSGNSHYNYSAFSSIPPHSLEVSFFLSETGNNLLRC
jgi:hypothetical protein